MAGGHKTLALGSVSFDHWHGAEAGCSNKTYLTGDTPELSQCKTFNFSVWHQVISSQE
jgi:hypothetical protein